MKQEYVLVLIIGLFILTYVLDAVVNPIPLRLATPYHYFTPDTMFSYAFTTTSVVLKAVALFIAPIWLLSFSEFSKLTKGAILLAIAGLMQLYALQDVATNSQVIPLEWSLSLTLAGLVLLIPAVIFLIAGFLGKAQKSISEDQANPWEDDVI